MEINGKVAFVIESNPVYPDPDNPDIYEYLCTDTNVYINIVYIWVTIFKHGPSKYLWKIAFKKFYFVYS